MDNVVPFNNELERYRREETRSLLAPGKGRISLTMSHWHWRTLAWIVNDLHHPLDVTMKKAVSVAGMEPENIREFMEGYLEGFVRRRLLMEAETI